MIEPGAECAGNVELDVTRVRSCSAMSQTLTCGYWKCQVRTSNARLAVMLYLG